VIKWYCGLHAGFVTINNAWTRLSVHKSQSPKRISISSAVFTEYIRATNTDTQTTLRMTLVPIDLISAMRAMTKN